MWIIVWNFNRKTRRTRGQTAFWAMSEECLEIFEYEIQNLQYLKIFTLFSDGNCLFISASQKYH